MATSSSKQRKRSSRAVQRWSSCSSCITAARTAQMRLQSSGWCNSMTRSRHFRLVICNNSEPQKSGNSWCKLLNLPDLSLSSPFSPRVLNKPAGGHRVNICDMLCCAWNQVMVNYGIHLLCLSSSSLDNASSSAASVVEALAFPVPLLLLAVLVLFEARTRPGTNDTLQLQHAMHVRSTSETCNI